MHWPSHACRQRTHERLVATQAVGVRLSLCNSYMPVPCTAFGIGYFHFLQEMKNSFCVACFFPEKQTPKLGHKMTPKSKLSFLFLTVSKKRVRFLTLILRAARFGDFTRNRNRFFMLFSLLRVMPFSSPHFSFPLLDSVVEPFHEALCSLTARATWQCAALQHTYLIHSSSSADDGSQDLCQQQDLSFVAFPPRALSSR